MSVSSKDIAEQTDGQMDKNDSITFPANAVGNYTIISNIIVRLSR